MPLNKTEAANLIAFLDDLSEKYGNAGCNDFYLPDTPDNRALVLAAEKRDSEQDEGRDEPELHVHNGKIGTDDHVVLDYIRDKLMKGYGLKDSDIPRQ